MQRQRAFNITDIRSKITDLHPVLQSSLQSGRARMRVVRNGGHLASFCEGGFVLLAQ